MTRGRTERHKRTCRRLILAFLVVIVAIIATATIKGNTGQQEGQERAEVPNTFQPCPYQAHHPSLDDDATGFPQPHCIPLHRHTLLLAIPSFSADNSPAG